MIPTEPLTSEDSSDFIAVAKSLALTLYIPIFLLQLGAGMLLPTLPLALRELDLSYQAITIVMAATGVGSLLSQIPIGRFMNRHSETVVVAGSTAILAMATALLGFSSAALVLLVLRFLAGVGTTGVILARQTFVSRAIDASVRGRAMSIFGGLTRLGFLFGPLLGAWLADREGFRAAFIVAGIIMTLGLAPLANATTRSATSFRSVGTASRDQSTFSRHRRVLLCAGAVQVCVIGVRYGRFIILPLIGEVAGLSISQIGFLVAIGSASDLMLVPVSGYIMDRFGRLAAIVPSFTLLGVGLVQLAAADGYGSILAAAVVIGIGNGLGAGTMMTLSADLAPAESPSEFLAILGTIREIGRIVVPVGIGFFGDRYGLDVAAVAMGLVSFLGVAIMIVAVGETRTPNPLPARP